MQEKDIPDPDVILHQFGNTDAIIHYHYHIVVKVPFEELTEIEMVDRISLLKRAIKEAPIPVDSEGVSVVITAGRNGKGIYARFEDGNELWNREL